MSQDTFNLFTRLHDKISKETTAQQSLFESLCSHTDLVPRNGVNACVNCGIEIHAAPDTKEWKYNGISNSKQMIDPSRCLTRPQKHRLLHNDLLDLGISDRIKNIANNIYIEVCKGKVHRGTRRKGIVFAVVFHSYKLDNNPQTCESLIKIFKIRRKDALRGLKFVNENMSKQSQVQNAYITPEHVIIEFLQLFQITDARRDEILKLYHIIANRSSILNRSRPQSVASGMIWYWLRKNKTTISIKEYVKHVHLSELTVNKIAREIARVCKRIENETKNEDVLNTTKPMCTLKDE